MNQTSGYTCKKGTIFLGVFVADLQNFRENFQNSKFKVMTGPYGSQPFGVRLYKSYL